MMKKILFILSCNFLAASLSFGAYKEIYWSARVASLGGAYSAVSDDASGIFYNAASTVKAKKRESNFSYARLFAGVDEVNFALSHFSYLHPTKSGGAMGVGWGNFLAKDLYREDTFLVSYGQDIKRYLPESVFDGELSVGVSVRYLMRSFTLDSRTVSDPVFKSGRISRNAGVDLHVYLVPEPNLFPGLSAALTLKNLNRPDVGFSEKERLPAELKGGILYHWRNILLPVDLTLRDQEIIPHFGSEVQLSDNKIALRLGSDISQVSTGFGYTYSLTEKFSIIIDYAFMWPLQLDSTVGSHRATLGLRF